MAWDTGMASVIRADEGESFLQEHPTGAVINVKLAPPQNPSNLYSAGTQTLPGNSACLPVTLSASEKLLYVLAGTGTISIGEEFRLLEPGTTVYVGRAVEHTIANTGTDELTMFFVLWPPTADARPLGVVESRPPADTTSPTPTPAPDLEPVTPPPATGSTGPALVLGPDDGDSYWQPTPTDGYATIKLSPQNLASNHVTVVEQVVPPGKLLPPHGHPRNEELKIIRTGTGIATVQGVEHVVGPGDLCVTGRWVEHSFLNTGDDDLTIFAVFMPPSLEILLAGIGRPRTVGEQPPEPFGLPDTVFQLAAEANLVIPDQIAAHDGGADISQPEELPDGVHLESATKDTP